MDVSTPPSHYRHCSAPLKCMHVCQAGCKWVHFRAKTADVQRLNIPPPMEDILSSLHFLLKMHKIYVPKYYINIWCWSLGKRPPTFQACDLQEGRGKKICWTISSGKSYALFSSVDIKCQVHFQAQPVVLASQVSGMCTPGHVLNQLV